MHYNGDASDTLKERSETHMAKKSKRSQRRPASTPSVKSAQAAGETAVAKPTFTPRVTGSSKVDLAQEYSYVFADLRKIAVIAVAMFALLIVLALVIK
jgi:hypothetical protein